MDKVKGTAVETTMVCSFEIYFIKLFLAKELS